MQHVLTPPPTVRVTAQSPSVAYYHLAKQVRVHLTLSLFSCLYSRATLLQFYHLECRAPSCPAAEVQGLNALSAKDKDLVLQAMASGGSA